MSLKYWVAEFTDGRSQVYIDFTRAKSAHNAAKYFEREYGGICYWIEGPFDSDHNAQVFIQDAEYELLSKRGEK